MGVEMRKPKSIKYKQSFKNKEEKERHKKQIELIVTLAFLNMDRRR